jgi:signal transduction histidine kinase
MAHLALIDEISEMAVGDLPSEHVFVEALRRIRQDFDLDVVAVYAGDPLTLRMQSGGVPVAPGTPVPAGLAQLAVRERRVVASQDLRTQSPWSPPPWASKKAKTEVALPISYRGRQIGVLDLCGAGMDALNEEDLAALRVLARTLSIVIAQEGWGTGGAASEELKRAYQRLQEFAELKGLILQNISHELRTPLTLIKGYLELLLEHQMGELQPQQRETLQTLCDRVDDIVTIVERTVALSPLQTLSLNYERIVVADLLDEVAKVFERRTTGSPVAVDVDPVDPALTFYGDVEKIKQVCYNLVDNSVKFSPQGGRVSIRAISDGSSVHLTISDQGIGIAEPQLTQIFETFYQIDGSSTRRFGGLGLGLTVVNRVVAAHRGEIWVESQLGRGSTFHVLLPKQVPQETERILG